MIVATRMPTFHTYLLNMASSVLDEALIVACRTGDLKEVRNLISKGANVSASGDLPVRIASECRNFGVLEYLVSHGATRAHLTARDRFWLVRYYTFRGKMLAQQLNAKERKEAEAASRIYFWWIPKCYSQSNSTGIHMAYRSLEAYEAALTAPPLLPPWAPWIPPQQAHAPVGRQKTRPTC